MPGRYYIIKRSKTLDRDQKFFDLYSLVIGVLVIAALGIYVLAAKISDRTQEVYKREGAEYQATVAARIRPFGEVYMPGEEAAAAAPVAATVSQPEPVAAALSGPQVYNSACLACHGAGVGGAPVLGNAEAWAPRIAQGMDVLKEHAIKGFQGSAGFMPAKGGRVDLSDEEVASAVDYMVTESQ